MIRVCLVAFAIACSTPAKRPTMSNDSCDIALDKLLAKDLASWTGLPAGCTLAMLGGKLELGTDEARGLLGTDGAAATYRRAKAAAYDEVMKIWLRGEAIVQIGVPLPELADPRALVRTLGEPEAKLDTHFQASPAVHKQGEWVYAKRGLALVLSFDRSTVMQLIVFPTTTLDDYVKRIRYVDQPREAPGEEGKIAP
jgi:hypothetical protein